MLALLDNLHRSGRTIVLITHEHDVAIHAQRSLLIRDGRVTDAAAHLTANVDLVGGPR